MALVKGSILHYTDMKKFKKKIFFSKTAGQNLELFHKIVACMTLFKSCSWNCDPSKKHGRYGKEAFYTVWNSSKFFSSETMSQISK